MKRKLNGNLVKTRKLELPKEIWVYIRAFLMKIDISRCNMANLAYIDNICCYPDFLLFPDYVKFAQGTTKTLYMNYDNIFNSSFKQVLNLTKVEKFCFTKEENKTNVSHESYIIHTLTQSFTKLRQLRIENVFFKHDLRLRNLTELTLVSCYGGTMLHNFDNLIYLNIIQNETFVASFVGKLPKLRFFFTNNTCRCHLSFQFSHLIALEQLTIEFIDLSRDLLFLLTKQLLQHESKQSFSSVKLVCFISKYDSPKKINLKQIIDIFPNLEVLLLQVRDTTLSLKGVEKTNLKCIIMSKNADICTNYVGWTDDVLKVEILHSKRLLKVNSSDKDRILKHVSSLEVCKKWLKDSGYSISLNILQKKVFKKLS